MRHVKGPERPFCYFWVKRRFTIRGKSVVGIIWAKL